MATWVLPWPKGVSTNSLYEMRAPFYRNGKLVTGGKRLSTAAVAWRNDAILRIRLGGQVAPVGEWVVTLRFWPPADGRKHDGDNLAKLVCDALAAAFGVDDERIVEHTILREPRSKEPHIELTLTASTRAPVLESAS